MLSHKLYLFENLKDKTFRFRNFEKFEKRRQNLTELSIVFIMHTLVINYFLSRCIYF